MTRRRQNFCDYSKHLNLLNAGETCWSRILDEFSCHRVLTILHEKRKAKKLTNQNKKGPRPIFSRYSINISTGHSFVAPHADALLARHAIVPNERAIVRKKSVTTPSERLRKRVQCCSVVDPLFHDPPLFDLFLQMLSLALIVKS